ncbi:hypothetical protein HanPSC8_Chr13g0592551 [Helianthus annuus]|nr:hypothetical protein HanPSC8_Chr13g0592551 [Helianthus annuus]
MYLVSFRFCRFFVFIAEPVPGRNRVGPYFFFYKLWNRVRTYGFFEPGIGSSIHRVGTGTSSR